MSKIEFSLFAPYNHQAMLKGCFSNWEEVPMEKGEDGFFSGTGRAGGWHLSIQVQSAVQKLVFRAGYLGGNRRSLCDRCR